jgi:hypothetical protein
VTVAVTRAIRWSIEVIGRRGQELMHSLKLPNATQLPIALRWAQEEAATGGTSHTGSVGVDVRGGGGVEGCHTSSSHSHDNELWQCVAGASCCSSTKVRKSGFSMWRRGYGETQLCGPAPRAMYGVRPALLHTNSPETAPCAQSECKKFLTQATGTSMMQTSRMTFRRAVSASLPQGVLGQRCPRWMGGKKRSAFRRGGPLQAYDRQRAMSRHAQDCRRAGVHTGSWCLLGRKRRNRSTTRRMEATHLGHKDTGFAR